MSIKQISILVISLMIISCSSNKNEEKELAKDEHAHHDHSASTGTSNSKSPRTAAMANIGSNHVHIDYSAPSVRGREIFGGLVAYDEVWVTGAHSATSISFNEDLEIEGKLIPAGKYALFTIPGKDRWTVILNTNFEQHLADDYDANLDVHRWEVTPVNLDQPQEQLKFTVESLGQKEGAIHFAWSNISFRLGLKVN
ncbi:DUF2911 domain-containing protein [Cecembia rubra]|uniref:DUF2911 domain-containing protein n=1 Tax=Cecembia rubra TaxID=1485585 RepID=UPI00271498DA|nr:DUF2911 domain-containing protein [Cecembia rubra]